MARLFQKGLLKVLEEMNLFLSSLILDKSHLGKSVFLLQQLLVFGGVVYFVCCLGVFFVNKYICSPLNIEFRFVKMLIHITGLTKIMCVFFFNFKANALWVLNGFISIMKYIFYIYLYNFPYNLS